MKTTIVMLRISEQEKEKWVAAAAKSGQSLSEFIRFMINYKIESEKEKNMEKNGSKTRVYFIETNGGKDIVYTYRNKAVNVTTKSNGYWCGIDLYGENATQELKKLKYENDYFDMIDASSELTENQFDFDPNNEEFEKIELIAEI